MQFTPATALRLGTTVEEMIWHPDIAVMKGAELLRKLLDSYDGDFIKALVSYNAGSLRCSEGKTLGYHTDGDYPMDVIKWSNTAILLHLPSSSAAAALILSAGIVSAGLILGDVWKPRWA
jgi:hypothetical protein